MALRARVDEAVQPQPAQVIGHTAGSETIGLVGPERRRVARLVSGREAARQEQKGIAREEQENSRIGESACLRPAGIDHDGTIHLAWKALFAQGASWLRLEPPAGVGWPEADLPQAGRFFSRLPMPKSRVLLMVVSVRSAQPSLWYCLMRALL